MSKYPIATILLSLIFIAPLRAGEGQTSSVLFSDDFNDRTTLGDAYTVAKAKGNAWTIDKGVLIGKQTESDHGTVVRTELPFANVDIAFDFRFRGGKSFNFVMDDKNDKTVHAGHVSRVSVYPGSIRLSDDKTGSMNLKVRQQRQAKDLTADQQAELADLLKRTQAKANVKIVPNQWHHLRICLRDDLMTVFLNKQQVASLQSPGLDHPTRNKLGFTVNGGEFDFDNLTIKKLEGDQ